MIKLNSPEGRNLFALLKKSTKKSNRDYLCVRCWTVYSYVRVQTHRRWFPEHAASIVSSRHFATRKKIVAISKEFGKYQECEGEVYVESPYKTEDALKRLHFNREISRNIGEKAETPLDLNIQKQNE